MLPIRNVAILAHVDAGKTTLSERLLFNAGVVRRPGNVEDGLATMDYLPEERERGITIESGVAHFEWKNIGFNLIDTPGHVDFGAEVDMALSAVEGAVLVVSALDGVETQTLSAWRKLREHQVRTLIFINKLDNPSSDLDETLIAIEEHLGARPVLLSSPGIDVISGSKFSLKEGKEIPQALKSSDKVFFDWKKAYQEAVEAASEFDDEILSLAMEGADVSPRALIRGLSKLCDSNRYVLCYAGSARENVGVRSLMAGLSFFLKEPSGLEKECLGEVIRLRHFAEGEIALFRSAKTLEKSAWPAGLSFFRLKAAELNAVDQIACGDIYALRADQKFSLGDRIGLDGCVVGNRTEISSRYDPLLQTHVECIRAEDYATVEKSLQLLSRMDPSIRVTPHPEAGFWVLHTVGEVQREVVFERLRREFGCEIRMGNPDVLWQERLAEELGVVENSLQVGPFHVEMSMSAKPLPAGEKDIRLSGNFLETATGEILAGIRSALLESAQVGFLGKGSLVGVEFKIDYFSYAEGTPVPMIKKACSDAVVKLISKRNIVLYEPFMEISLECPAEYAGALSGDILSRRGKIIDVGGNGILHSFKAELPLRNLFGYATAVRSGCQGRAQYSVRFLEYRKSDEK